MKIVLSLLKVFFGLVALFLIATFFMPSKIHVERTAVVNGSPEVVYGLINNLKDWNKWSPWHRLDKNMKVEYGPASEGTGAYYSWKSEHDQVGNGKLTISEARPTEYLKTEMNFMENGVATAEFFLRPVENGTEVKWTMDSDMGMNPIGKVMGLFMDKWVGGDYEKGLHYLDSVAQRTKPEPFSMQLEMGRFPGSKVLLVKGTAKESEISKTLGDVYAKIGAFMGKNNLLSAGPPLALYEDPNGGTLYTFEAGFPVNEKPKAPLADGIFYKELPASEAMICHFSGPWDKTSAAYPALEKAIAEKGKSLAGKPMEMYVSDPAMAKNPLDIKTDIYWPVK